MKQVFMYIVKMKNPRDIEHGSPYRRKTSSKQETEDLGIEIGNFISFDPRTEITSSGFIKSRHLDDKASVAMILDLLERIKSEQIKLPHTIQFYISNNEEIGYGANASISNKIVEFIAFDMGHLERTIF